MASLQTMTTGQLIAYKRQVGVFSPDERAVMFGDVSHSTQRSSNTRDALLVDRYLDGLPLSKSDAREARRLLQGGSK